jgi:hypothetical protein
MRCKAAKTSATTPRRASSDRRIASSLPVSLARLDLARRRDQGGVQSSPVDLEGLDFRLDFAALFFRSPYRVFDAAQFISWPGARRCGFVGRRCLGEERRRRQHDREDEAGPCPATPLRPLQQPHHRSSHESIIHDSQARSSCRHRGKDRAELFTVYLIASS